MSQLAGNPKGIESSSPGLRGTSYPGAGPEGFSTPTGLRPLCQDSPQPRWGCGAAARFPKVARSSQPWALSRNPVGIQQGNSRKALCLIRIPKLRTDEEKNDPVVKRGRCSAPSLPPLFVNDMIRENSWFHGFLMIPALALRPGLARVCALKLRAASRITFACLGRFIQRSMRRRASARCSAIPSAIPRRPRCRTPASPRSA